jgi:hypothetical protein
MTKTRTSSDPTAFNFHGYYMGVTLCALLDIDFHYWDALPSDFSDNDESVLEWIEHAQDRLNRACEFSPVEGMDSRDILEIATRAADQINHHRRNRIVRVRLAESVH